MEPGEEPGWRPALPSSRCGVPWGRGLELAGLTLGSEPSEPVPGPLWEAAKALLVIDLLNGLLEP